MIQRLLKMYPDENWDYSLLSENPHITLDYVLKHLDKQWNWSILSMNPSITLEDIIEHPECPWNNTNIIKNPNITLEDILEHPEIFSDLRRISENPNITLDYIMNHPECSWDWLILSWNKKIEDILNHPDLPWNWHYVSYNLSLTYDIVKNNPDKSWNYNTLSKNSNITFDDVKNDFEKPWNFNFSHIINITLNDMLTFDCEYDSPYEHYKFFDEYDLVHFLKNPNCKINDIEKILQMKFKNDDDHLCLENIWMFISQNPNLSLDFIKKYKNNINFEALSLNPLDHRLVLKKKTRPLRVLKVFDHLVDYIMAF